METNSGSGNVDVMNECADGFVVEDGSSYLGEVDDTLGTLYISPGCKRYLLPNCAADVKPFVGQVFATIDEAIKFYSEYGRMCGFDIRRGSEKRFHTGIIQSKRLHCSREGFYPKTDGKSKNDGFSSTTKRKNMFSRCGCPAMVVVKYNKSCLYEVTSFVERHNHRFASAVGKQFMKGNRSMTVAHQSFAFDCAKVKIGPTRAFGLMKELVGGYDKIGATAVDFKNWNRDLKNVIGNADAQVILNIFQSLKESSKGEFYYEYDVDASGKLTKLFWADSIGRRNYDVFGDVISVDATFNTNKYNMVFVPFCGVDNHRKCVTFAAALLSKEDSDHYKWLFRALVGAMGRAPLCILTDQCAAMKQAIAEVFDTNKTKHRLCMWHIMKKLPSKVGVVLCMDGGFLSKLKPFVWGENLDASEFEAGWKSVLDEYKLSENKWLSEMYECRDSWIPAFFRDDPLLGILRTTSWSESANSFFSHYHQSGDTLCQFYLRFETAMHKQRHVNDDLNHKSNVAFPSTDTELFLERDAAELYTREIFYKFQKQVKDACFHLAIKDMTGVEVKKFSIYDPKAAKCFEVLHVLEGDKVECSCRLFERTGLPCRHLILALKQVPVHKLPRHLVLNRWMKNAEKNGSRIFTTTTCDDKEKFGVTVNDIWFDFNSCMGLAGDDKEALDLVTTSIKDVKEKLRDWKFKGKKFVVTKKTIVEKFIGCEIPDNIAVQPPNESRNKGCGTKRIKSAAEKASMLAGKVKRICKACNKEVYHDSRNCPVANANVGLKKSSAVANNRKSTQKDTGNE